MIICALDLIQYFLNKKSKFLTKWFSKKLFQNSLGRYMALFRLQDCLTFYKVQNRI